MTDRYDDLIRLKVALEGGIPIPSDIAAWLCRGIEAFSVGRTKSLCVALGLRGAGIRSVRLRDQIKRRDLMLRYALEACARYPGESLWSQCGTLAEQIRRYPRSREENPLLKAVFAVGIDVPQSQSGVFERITSSANTPAIR